MLKAVFSLDLASPYKLLPPITTTRDPTHSTFPANEQTTLIMSSPYRYPVHKLPINYFIAHNVTCDICRYAKEADVEEGNTGISRTSVVAIVACGHIFHGLCVFTWVEHQVNSRRNGTCPMCRCVLVVGQDVEHEMEEEDMVEEGEEEEVSGPVWSVTPEELDIAQRMNMQNLLQDQRAAFARLEADYLVLRASIEDTNGMELDRLEMDHRVQLVELRDQQHLERTMLAEEQRFELAESVEQRRT
jgi:hypothetical protein